MPVPELSPGERRFRDDDGSADTLVAAALAAFAAGQGSEQAALTALAAARLLVPLVAALADGEPPGRSAKVSEIALPTLVGRDGRTALPVFTSLDALTRWRSGARPVPREAGLVWQAADRDGHAVVIDVAGPVPLPVEGARLAALASGGPVPPPHRDPDIQAAVDGVAARHPALVSAVLHPGQAGTDLLIQLTLAAGTGAAAGSALAARLGEDVMAALGDRLRRGVGVAVAPAARLRPGGSAAAC